MSQAPDVLRPTRRQFMQGAALVGAGLLAGCGRLPFQTQQPAKLPRIGYLSGDPTTDDVHARRIERFQHGLQELGYVEGQNLLVEWRWGGPRPDQFREQAAELVQLSVDVIVVGTGPALFAARAATSTIPVVVLFSGDMVPLGLVASYARPGGNITGLTFMSAGLAGKRLQLLKDAMPGMSRVAVLWTPFETPAHPEMAETQVAALELGLALQSVEVRDPRELSEAFAAMVREQADGFLTFAHTFSFDNRRRIVELAAASRLPGMYGWKEFVEVGGLMAYGPRLSTLYRRAGSYVDKLLKGANPAELPMEQPHEFDLVLNLKTARALGLTIPERVLVQATEVIE
jgi:putative ABC transport system substrate-binding protein